MSTGEDRRLVLYLIAGAAATLALTDAKIATASEPELKVEWRVAPEQVEAVKSAMQVKTAETYDQRNPILIGAVVLVGAAIVPRVAQSIVDVYYRYTSGGVIVDTRSQPVVVSTSQRVAPGYALIISADSVKTIQIGGAQPISGDDLKGLMDVLISAVPKG